VGAGVVGIDLPGTDPTMTAAMARDVGDQQHPAQYGAGLVGVVSVGPFTAGIQSTLSRGTGCVVSVEACPWMS
jgi:hypothetical protein